MDDFSVYLLYVGADAALASLEERYTWSDLRTVVRCWGWTRTATEKLKAHTLAPGNVCEMYDHLIAASNGGNPLAQHTLLVWHTAYANAVMQSHSALGVLGGNMTPDTYISMTSIIRQLSPPVIGLLYFLHHNGADVYLVDDQKREILCFFETPVIPPRYGPIRKIRFRNAETGSLGRSIAMDDIRNRVSIISSILMI